MKNTHFGPPSLSSIQVASKEDQKLESPDLDQGEIS